MGNSKYEKFWGTLTWQIAIDTVQDLSKFETSFRNTRSGLENSFEVDNLCECAKIIKRVAEGFDISIFDRRLANWMQEYFEDTQFDKKITAKKVLKCLRSETEDKVRVKVKKMSIADKAFTDAIEFDEEDLQLDYDTMYKENQEIVGTPYEEKYVIEATASILPDKVVERKPLESTIKYETNGVKQSFNQTPKVEHNIEDPLLYVVRSEFKNETTVELNKVKIVDTISLQYKPCFVVGKLYDDKNSLISFFQPSSFNFEQNKLDVIWTLEQLFPNHRLEFTYKLQKVGFAIKAEFDQAETTIKKWIFPLSLEEIDDNLFRTTLDLQNKVCSQCPDYELSGISDDVCDNCIVKLSIALPQNFSIKEGLDEKYLAKKYYYGEYKYIFLTQDVNELIDKQAINPILLYDPNPVVSSKEILDVQEIIDKQSKKENEVPIDLDPSKESVIEIEPEEIFTEEEQEQTAIGGEEQEQTAIGEEEQEQTAIGEEEQEQTAIGEEEQVPIPYEQQVYKEPNETTSIQEEPEKAVTVEDKLPTYEFINSKIIYDKGPKKSSLNIKISESLKGIYDEGTLLLKESKGTLEIENPGKESNIFDIGLKLDNYENLDLKEQLHIHNLSPQKLWVREYTIKDIEQSDLPFDFEQKIDTYTENKSTSHVLLKDKETEVELIYNIKLKRNLDEIVLKSSLPKEFEQIKINSSKGEVKIEDNALIWEIEDLTQQEENIQLSIVGKILPRTIDPISTGPTLFKYTEKNEKSCQLVIRMANAHIRKRLTLEAEEIEERPNMWRGKLLFRNKSEFPVEVYSLRVVKDGNSYLDVKHDTPEILPEYEQLTTESWEVESEDIPQFEANVKSTLNVTVNTEVGASLEFREKELVVASGEGQKTYTKTVVPSFSSSLIGSILNITNTGAVTYEKILIRDELPNYFLSPKEEEIQVFVIRNGDETKLSREDYTLQVESEKQIEKVRDLSFIINTRLEPNDIIRIKYDTTVKKPPKEIQFQANPVATVSLVEPSPEFTIPITDTVNTIKISHIRRRITSAKDILPRRAEGIYEITLFFKNRGEEPIEYIKLKDLIPEGFKLEKEDDQIKSELVKKVDQGEIRQWIIEKIEANQEIEIVYSLKGEGRYSGEDLLVSY